MKDGNSCANCFYSGETNQPDSVACFRYPPQLFIAEDDEEQRFFTQFPFVNPNWWCGEHKLNMAMVNITTPISRRSQ